MAKNLQKSAILAREEKAWRVVDQLLSDRNPDKRVKLRAAEFILSRIYPEKHEIEGAITHNHFFQNVIRKSKDTRFHAASVNGRN